MSFQDFASNSSSRPRPGRSSAGARPAGTATTTTGALSGSAADALRPISESLLQYQVRTVDPEVIYCLELQKC